MVKILGVDPGSRVVGWAAIGPLAAKAGALEMKDGALPQRLYALGMALSEVFKATRPDVVVVERAFVGPNRLTSLIIAEARAVALFVAASWQVEIVECANNTAKKALTGDGRASKEKVALFATRLGRFERALSWDESDAYALAFWYAETQRKEG